MFRQQTFSGPEAHYQTVFPSPFSSTRQTRRMWLFLRCQLPSARMPSPSPRDPELKADFGHQLNAWVPRKLLFVAGDGRTSRPAGWQM